MKKILLATLLILATTTAFAAKKVEGVLYNWKILKVVDGDTVQVEAKWVPPPISPKVSIRIYGVDTPEKGFRAKCDAENQRGLAASAFTKKVITESKTAQVLLMDWDKYGGRVLGDIILDNGVSLRQLLIQNGFAREYYGDAKQSWCN